MQNDQTYLITDATGKRGEIAERCLREGKVTNIREYIDTQALARASEMDAGPWF